VFERQSGHRRLQTSPRELRGQLAIVVTVLWAIGALNTLNRGFPPWSSFTIGTDFLHFYALARVGSDDITQFANSAFVREAQLSGAPESRDHVYPAVYGPQVAIALAPLARLPYGTALVVWSAVTVVLYFAAMAIVLRNTIVVGQYFSIGLLAAAGFPPFWYLVQYGQLSAVALCAIVGSAIAVNRGNEVVAGAVLGLLIYKPPLFVPILGVLLLSGSWRITGAMSISAALEVLSTALWVGIDGLNDYWQLILRLPSMASMMAARTDQMHSLRAFWSLLLGESALTLILYAVTALASMMAAAYIWRRVADPSLRMSALLLGTVLASPHLYVYDLVILAPVWIWLTDWFLTQTLPRSVGRSLYIGYLAALFGYLVPVLRVQLSVLCFAYLLMSLWWWTLRDRRRDHHFGCSEAQLA
jgi:hypothetical protein